MKPSYALLTAIALLSPHLACAAETAPAKACPHTYDPNALQALAQTCAKGLSGDANCRAHATDEIEYVIVRDCSPEKPEAYLFIPVEPVTGVDDSHILDQPLVEMWEDAWRWSRTYPGKPAARTALAINSKSGRSQNQLHIHMSCVRAEVSAALASVKVPFFPADPVTLPLGPNKNVYRALKVKSLGGRSSPFKVAESLPGAAGDMKDQSIAVVGTAEPDEYYVLDTAAAGANRGHAEELLDQYCR